MSRRSRLLDSLATIGYLASRLEARLPRPESLHGDSLSFGAEVRYELPSHTASGQNQHGNLDQQHQFVQLLFAHGYLRQVP